MLDSPNLRAVDKNGGFMEFRKIIKNEALYIPVTLSADERFLEIFQDDKKIFEFKIPVGNEKGKEYDYLAKLPVSEYVGKELTFKGDFSHEFFNIIDCVHTEDNKDENRPLVHFTAKTGWINDPNGLIYDGEYYHLYFQYNPFNVIWANMSWGHAVSKDLIYWEQKESVMFPDENGMIFSGCGIIVDGEYCFPYTVAGTSTPWSEGKPFYQGLAKSFDRGETLVKMKEPFLGITGKDSRDPKIFWHEESHAYIMVLYLENTDFAIYRSTDFKKWVETQRFTLDKAWECPNLVKVPVEGGGFKWMFWAADGFYYWGEFDGYTFYSDWKEHMANFNSVPYAAQTFWGIKDRIVQMTWLRLERNGINYNGAMGIPRTLSCKQDGDDYLLLQKPVDEFTNLLTEQKINDGKPYMVELEVGNNKSDILDLEINGSSVTIDFNAGKITVDEKTDLLPENVEKIQLIVDYNILEITINYAIMAVYKVNGDKTSFYLNWREYGNTKGCSKGDRINSNYCLKSFK